VFFNGNYAVHGTTAVDNLGQPASHGCIRLHPDHAAIFFELTEMVGLNQALVMVVD
jgi:lipoprotein-anchoring transpeptidase ErfK/SrfK